MKKIINPIKHKFVFELSDDECHKQLTGVCSLDKPFVDAESGEASVSYCQNLYKNLIEQGQRFSIELLEATCGHFEFNDGQHRTCIAQRKGLKLKAYIEKGDSPCEVCEPPNITSDKSESEVVYVDLEDFSFNRNEDWKEPKPVNISKLKRKFN